MKINNVNFYNTNPYKYQRSPVTCKQVIAPKMIYDERNVLTKIIFSEPTGLKDICDYFMQPTILRQLSFNWRCIRDLQGLKTSKFAETKIKELIGMGASALAFLLENGNVLKITYGKHLRRELENFDIPVYEQGVLLPNIYYYIEQYADTESVTKDEILELINKIRAMSYEVCDVYDSFWVKNDSVRDFQFGKTPDGKVYLLDPECAYKGK